jgi:hypothetical protein
MRCVDVWRKAGLPAEELREMAGIHVAHVKGNGRQSVMYPGERKSVWELIQAVRSRSCHPEIGSCPTFGRRAKGK